MLERGFVQVYTGNGKGKTTAALGLALRMAGNGGRVFFGQFMKGRLYGEHRALSALPQIDVQTFGGSRCLRREEVTEKDREMARRGLEISRQAMLSGRYDLVVLDEINVTLWFGLLSDEAVKTFLDERPGETELLLTGRYAPQWLIERADLVTEMKPIKHYYDSGVMARDGIER